MRCLDSVPAQARATWNEVDLLLGEMVLRLAHIEECRWSTVFWFCFRLPDTTTRVSTTSSRTVLCRLTSGAIGATRMVLDHLGEVVHAGETKPLLHPRKTGLIMRASE